MKSNCATSEGDDNRPNFSRAQEPYLFLSSQTRWLSSFRMPEHDQQAECSCCRASFLDLAKSETPVCPWIRAMTLAARVGKGLLEDNMAQHLYDRQWVEKIDHPRHRYGHNLLLYHDIWSQSNSPQPFFFWLDHGDGNEVNLEDCPRTKLQQECVKYLGPKERSDYEVVIKKGKFVYKKGGEPLTSTEGSKLIFVLSTSRKLYVGEKKKGFFHHSSFLAGAATIASGRLALRAGILQGIWLCSGHYRPKYESLTEFCRFLEEHDVDLTNVKKYAVDEDIPPKVNNKGINALHFHRVTSSNSLGTVDDTKDGADM
ncbi:hypothetical protein SLE2022_384800 [Rubroshorea leprosula]